MTVKREDLSVEARRAFETWVSLGFSEASAMEQLRRDGLIVEGPFDRRVCAAKDVECINLLSMIRQLGWVFTA